MLLDRWKKGQAKSNMNEAGKQKKSERNFHGITSKIVVSYCLLVILPFFLFTGITFTYFWNRTLREIGTEMSDTMAVAASSLRKKIKEDENDSNLFTDNGLVNQIQKDGKMSSDLAESIQNDLIALCNANSTLHGAYLITNEDTLHGGGNYAEVLSEMEAHEEEIRNAGGRCLWFPSMEAHGRAGEYRFVMARSLNSRTEQNVGFLYLIFSNQTIQDLMAGTRSGNVERLLTDKNGTVLYSNNGTETGSSVDISMIPKNKKNYNQTISKKNEGRFLLASCQIYTPGWFCISTVSVRQLMGGFLENLLPYFLMFGVCILFLLVMIWILKRQVFTPLQTLKSVMDGYAQNELTVTDVQPIGNDEFKSISGHFNRMTKRISALMEAYKKEEDEKNRQRLKTLSAQLTPHFVYNALNTIKWVAVLNHQEQIQHLTESLIVIFMNAARADDENYTLADELQLVESYAVIQKARFMNFDLSIDEGNVKDASRLHFRKLLLQPVVENAIVHGLGRGRIRNGQVTIRIWTDELLHITVTDNGCGFDVHAWEKNPEKRENHTNIGLKNVEQIIQLEFGSSYGMEIESEPGKGTCVTYKLPKLSFAPRDAQQNLTQGKKKADEEEKRP